MVFERQFGTLSTRGVFLTLLVCALVVAPTVFGMSDASQSYPEITVRRSVDMESVTGSEIVLVELVDELADGTQRALSFQWVKEPADWFPTWSLRLESSIEMLPTGLPAKSTPHVDVQYVQLPEVHFVAGHTYEVVLSYSAEHGALALRIDDISEGKTVYIDGYTVPSVVGRLYAVTGETAAGYTPVNIDWAVGIGPNGQRFLPIHVFPEPDADGLIRLHVVGPIPDGTFVIDSEHEGQANPLAWLQAAPGEHWIELSLRDLPIGSNRIRVHYVKDDRTVLIGSQDIMIGGANAQFQLTDVARHRGTAKGNLVVDAPDSLSDVDVRLEAIMTRITWDGITNVFTEEAWGPRHTILATELGKVDSNELIDIPLPTEPGVWKLDVHVETNPSIRMNLEGKTAYIFNLEGDDYPIAVGDGATRQVRVYDSEVKDWSRPEAALWVWQPNIRLGYSHHEIGLWSGIGDVKLRRHDLCDGQCILAVSGDLATIASYPSGLRRWAVQTGIGTSLHAIELLPNGNVAVAASNGNWVRVYASSQGPNANHFTEYSLPGAHGVLWDPSRELLWAVGDYHLVALKVVGNNDQPGLSLVHESRLPTNWGHDLSPVYGDPDRLWVTTNTQVYQYVKSTDTWLRAYWGGTSLAYPRVKSIGNQPSGQLVLTRPNARTIHEYTTDIVEFLYPSDERSLPGTEIYKMRIWSEAYQ